MSSLSRGFTLVELIVVIVLLGIVSIVVLPRFSDRSGFAEFALRDQLISSFRYAQQQAMYDQSGSCYRLRVDANGFASEQGSNPIGPVDEITFTGDYANLSVLPIQSFYFDGLGNVYTDTCINGTLLAADPFVLTIGSTGVSVYPTGYIRAN